MTYVEGFVTAVPTANKEKYIAHAEAAAAMILDYGAARFVETWGDDIQPGKVTDFAGAVQATADETVLFSWFEYPDRAARDAANAKMMADPRMADMAKDMPFDGSRMIYAGFSTILEQGEGRGGYVDGIIVPVPTANQAAYAALAERSAPIFRDHGALRVVENWGDEVSDGKVTDYKRATKAQDDETVAYSWIEWPDRASRDAGWAKIMADDRMKTAGDPPFDGQRMFWGGFQVILDKSGAQ